MLYNVYFITKKLFRGHCSGKDAWCSPHLMQVVSSPTLWFGCVFWLKTHEEVNPVFRQDL